MNLENFKEIIEAIGATVLDVQAKAARKELELWRKEGLDVVTDADLHLEDRIVRLLHLRSPGVPVRSEEGYPREVSGQGVWVVDPLDGTINFAAGSPFFAVSIAYQARGRTEYGAVMAPALEARYIAGLRTGAFRGDTRLRVSPRSLRDSTVSITLTSHFTSNEIGEVVGIVGKLAGRVRGLRIFVCESLELAWVAEGILDAHICTKPDVFGVAAGSLLVEEAGGKLSTLSGAPFEDESPSLIASNGVIHDELVLICQN